MNDFERLQARLAALGFDVQMIGGMCPFQIEANHKDGYSIYMRCRGKTCSLDVYNCHYDYDSGLPDKDEYLIWEGWFNCWGDYEAGYVTPNDADYVFSMLWANAKELVNV